MVTPVYPASNNQQAIDLNISNANQFFTILQGGIEDFIPTYEGNGEIPSVAKALNEAAAYKVPLAWQTTGDETDLLQPRIFNEDIYVPLTVPAPFSTAPSNEFWRLYSEKTAQVLIDTLTFTGDGFTTDFSIPSMVVDDPSAYLVSVDGVYQRPTIDYTVNVSTDTLSFTEAPPTTVADNISVTILGALRGALAEEIYETTADGLANTSDGQFFNVVNTTDPEAFIDLYKNNAGAALLIDTYPNSVAYNNLANAVAYEADLASNAVGDGSDLIAHTGTSDTVTEALDKRTIFVGSVAENFAGRYVVDGQNYNVTGWHNGGAVMSTPMGGGIFVGSEGTLKSEHNGVTVVSPTVPPVSQQTGASLVERRNNFLAGAGETDPTGSGAFLRKGKTLDIAMSGSLGDNSSDDTVSIQTVFDISSRVEVPPGTYMVEFNGVNVRSNMDIFFHAGAHFKMIPNSEDQYQLLMLEYIENTNIYNLSLIGDRAAHTGTTGEAGHGMRIQASKNIGIYGGTIRDFWGDGIYLGAYKRGEHYNCQNVTLKNLEVYNNRRQGLSITGLFKGTIENCIFRDTNGTAPQAGIDIEPNIEFQCKDISLINVQCYGNAASGMDLNDISSDPENETPIDTIQVIGGSYSNNAGAGIFSRNAKNLIMSGVVVKGNASVGGVTLTVETTAILSNSFVFSNLAPGVLTNNGASVDIDNCTIFNNSAGIRFAGRRDSIKNSTVRSNNGRGIQVYDPAIDTVISDCEIRDNASYGIFLSSPTRTVIKGNYIHGNSTSDQVNQMLLNGVGSIVRENTVRKGFNTLKPAYGASSNDTTMTFVDNDMRDSGETGDLNISVINTVTTVIERNFPYRKRGLFENRPPASIAQTGDDYFVTDAPADTLIYYIGGGTWKDGSGNTYT